MLLCIWSNDLLFTIIFVIAIAAIILALAVNIISIIHIKSVFQIIKTIFCEIIISTVLNIVFYLLLVRVIV